MNNPAIRCSRRSASAPVWRFGRFAGGNADRKFIAAVGTMTVSLRQTKKFLASHKLLMTLRARDIFKISHAALLYSDWNTGIMEY
jgi:hypothetical protein